MRPGTLWRSDLTDDKKKRHSNTALDQPLRCGVQPLAAASQLVFVLQISPINSLGH